MRTARQCWAWMGVAVAALLGACAGDGGPTSSAWADLTHYWLDDSSPENGPKLLHTGRLREVARSCGVGTGPSPLPFNREVGSEFQRWALRAFPGGPLRENFQNLPSATRRAATRLRPGGPVRSVRPDAVGDAVSVVWERLLGIPRPRATTPAPGSVLVEVKAVRGFLMLHSNWHQITGFIDVAANSPAGRMVGSERPTPAIVFITTGDTQISPEVLNEASRLHVAVWQTVVFELPGSVTANPRFGLGPVVPLNPVVYGGSFPQPLPPGPTNVPFPVRGSGRPQLLDGDPDPPEVQ